MRWDLTSSQESMLTTVVFLGSLIGSGIWGAAADRIGRRRTLLVIGTATFLFGAASAFSQSYGMLIFFRGSLGLCLGGFAVAFSYFMELLPTEARGKWGVLMESWWTVGSMFEALLAWIVFASGGSWRMLVGLSSAPLLLVILSFRILPQSPRYLIISDRRDTAEDVLKRAAELNGKSSDFSLAALPADASSPEKSLGLRETLRILFSPRFARTTTFLWFMWFSVALAYYGVVLMTTSLMSTFDEDELSNSTTPKCELGGHNIPFVKEDYTDVFVASVSEFPGLILAIIFVDRIGRRKSQFASFGLCGVFLFLMAILPSSRGLDTFLLFFARMFINAAFLIIYLYTPEVYPTAIRTSGLGAAFAFARLGGMLSPFVGQNLVENGKAVAAQLIMCACCIVSAIASMALRVETAGVALQDTASTDVELVGVTTRIGADEPPVDMTII